MSALKMHRQDVANGVTSVLTRHCQTSATCVGLDISMPSTYSTTTTFALQEDCQVFQHMQYLEIIYSFYRYCLDIIYLF